MASLSEIYLTEKTLETLLKGVKAKQSKGIGITISISDQTKHRTFDNGNTNSQNVSAWVSQTKEDRENKKDKYYIGNGKVFWTDGKIVLAEKPNVNQQA